VEVGWLALDVLTVKRHEISSFVGVDYINHCNIIFSYGLYCEDYEKPSNVLFSQRVYIPNSMECHLTLHLI